VSEKRPYRLAYADPPYLGCGRKLYGVHHPDAARWDDKGAHVELLAELDGGAFDAWAYSCLPRDLEWVLPLVPGARIGAWVKPFCAWKPWQKVAQAWEPVVYRTTRTTVETGQGHLRTRDWVSASMTSRRGLPGAKPEDFCRWLLDVLGYEDGDELVDFFPGTRVLGSVAAQLTLAGNGPSMTGGSDA
jgi:hypothetical protein